MLQPHRRREGATHLRILPLYGVSRVFMWLFLTLAAIEQATVECGEGGAKGQPTYGHCAGIALSMPPLTVGHLTRATPSQEK